MLRLSGSTRPASRFAARFVALWLVILPAACTSCSSARPETGTASPTPSIASAVQGSAAAGRLAPCASTNDGLAPLPFLSSAQPANVPPLLPNGAEAALVCRYAGVGESRPAGALVASVQIGGKQAAAIASLLDVDVPVDLTGMPPACPSNSGVIFVLQFLYPQARVITAISSLNGCAWTVVGDRAVWTSSSALNALAALAGGQVAHNVFGPQP